MEGLAEMRLHDADFDEDEDIETYLRSLERQARAKDRRRKRSLMRAGMDALLWAVFSAVAGTALYLIVKPM